MNNNIRVIIADDNEGFAYILKDYLDEQDGISVVAIAHNGIQAVNLIEQNESDIVILDLIMPLLDGLGVLEKVNSLNMVNKPLFIVLSALSQENITNLAIGLGAAFYIVKPFDLVLLVQRIKQLKSYDMPSISVPHLPIKIENGNEPSLLFPNITAKVSNVLSWLGIPSHLKGYQYLLESISLVVDDFTLINSVTKRLYPLVAETFLTSPINIERAMRNTINVTLSKGVNENMTKLLGYETQQGSYKVTNSEFIAKVANRIRFE